MAVDSDEGLVGRVLSGDRECFGELVLRYKDAVFGVALSRTGSLSDAQDIAQDTFLKAFESLAALRHPSRFGGWLYRIALNMTRMHIRRATRRDEATSDSPALKQMASGSQVAERREILETVLAALGRLPETQRETATLFYIDGYSQEEIGKFTGRPPGTVRRRLHEARKSLKKELVTMVESELKRSRPGESFAKDVVRRISQVQVRIIGQNRAVLLLRDDSKRIVPIVSGEDEGKAIVPWIAGRGSRNGLDSYGALTCALQRFDCAITRFCVNALKDRTFYGILEVRTNKGCVEVDCRPSDGLNLAVRAGAPIFVDHAVADRVALRDDKGRLLRSGEEEKLLRRWRRQRGPFADVSAALRSLERDPTLELPRKALIEASGLAMMPPLLKKRAGTLRVFSRWARERKGTRHEAMAVGLLGATQLVRHWEQPEKAVAYLEEAHRLDPEAKDVAWDLATAYARTGRKADATQLIEEHDLREQAKNYGNFASLWSVARFRSLLGNARPRAQQPIRWAQLRTEYIGTVKGGPMGEALKARKVAANRVRQIAGDLGCSGLLRVESLTAVTQGKRTWWILDAGGGHAMALRLTQAQGQLTPDLKPGDFPRPMTNMLICDVLRAAGLKLEAAVLLKRGRRGVEAGMVVRDEKRRETIPVSGAEAIAIAFAGKCPVLIDETLAEKLYVRGKNGRPLSIKGAARLLRESEDL